MILFDSDLFRCHICCDRQEDVHNALLTQQQTQLRKLQLVSACFELFSKKVSAGQIDSLGCIVRRFNAMAIALYLV